MLFAVTEFDNGLLVLPGKATQTVFRGVIRRSYRDNQAAVACRVHNEIEEVLVTRSR